MRGHKLSSVTCWVLDHPAHLQLLSGFIRAGNKKDLLIITRRPEIESMLESDEVNRYLPEREIVRVPRLAGKNIGLLRKVARGLIRRRIVNQALKERKGESKVQRIVSIGAPLELRVGKSRKVRERWYVSDTEPNKIAHRLGITCATDVLLPKHWNGHIDGGWLDYIVKKRIRLHRYEGVHGHVHLSTPKTHKKKEFNDKKIILIRKIMGDGIHDGDELLQIQETLINNDFNFEFRDEVTPEKANWSLPSELIKYDGVITQSVTLASESAIQGIPTLLISRAKRGFLEYLDSGHPNFYRVVDIGGNIGEKWNQLLAKNVQVSSMEYSWPDTRKRWIELFGPWNETLDE
jgi:predicted glycosyltransferase